MPSSDEGATAPLFAVCNTDINEPTDGTDPGSAADNVITLPHAGTRTQVPPALDSVLANALRAEQAAGVLAVLRLGEYRLLKEVFGYALARELLVQIVRRLGTVLRAGDLLVPLDDDEFVILIGGVSTAQAAVQVMERLLTSCRGVYDLRHRRVQAHPRLGIARFPGDGTDPAELLHRARIALHETGTAHAVPYRFFSLDLYAQVHERVWLAAELEGTVDEGRLELHYQPVFAMDSQRTVGAEALLRLRTTSGELVAPERFIPLAEELGLIVPIGAWVLRKACRQLARWRRVDLGTLRMAVNVSPHQLADPCFAATVDAAVTGAGIAYEDLELEITESAAVDRFALIERSFAALRDKGVHIALDDFGTGFSALANLACLPVGIVKIDRAFLRNVPEDERAKRIVSAVIAMTRELGMETVAEGVENEAQFRFLAAAGCRLGQGFGYAKPQMARNFPHACRSTPPWAA